MLIHSLAFLLGLTLLVYWPGSLPQASWLLLPLFAVVALCLAGRYRLVGIPLGLVWAWLPAHALLAQVFPTDWAGRDLPVTGRVLELPEPMGRRQRFLLQCISWLPPGAEKPVACNQRFRLNWYRASPRLRAGETWRFTLRLKPPMGFMNPGGFDYEQWLFRQGISATGYVRAKPPPQRLAEPDRPALREWLAERISLALEGQAGGRVIPALALGLRSTLSDQDWQRFQRTGTSHLLAISGLHVGMVSVLGFWLGRWLWSRSQWLTNRIAAPRVAWLLALLFALLYAGLAGFSIPTQRATLMVGVLALSAWLQRENSRWDALGLALLAVLVWDPFSPLDIGFWLSFASVAWLFLLLPERGKSARRWLEGLRVSGVLTLALMPLSLAFFHYASLVAPLANLVAVPWVSFVTLPLTLSGTLLIMLWPAAGNLLLGWAATSFHWLDAGLQLLAALPFAGLHRAAPSWPVMLLAFVGSLWLLAPRPLPARYLGLLLIVPLLSVYPQRPEQGQAIVTLLDVGQGLSAVVSTRNHTLVFDTGPAFPSGFNTGEAVLAPFLIEQGIPLVDTLIVSHGDNDHIGGARALSERFPIWRVLTSVPDRIDWRYSQSCRAGQSWHWDGVGFELLHPPAAASWSGNNASCVLRVSAGDEQLLLPGDIEAAAERWLLDNHRQRLPAEVLIAPHHGSRTSSTEAFIAAVAPRWVLFPAARFNRYHFPRPAIVARYQERGIGTLSTGREGAIRVMLGAAGQELTIQGYRRRSPRIWRFTEDESAARVR